MADRAANGGGTASPIEPGLVARLAAGVRLAFTGKAPDWFGPAQPIAPVAPPEVAGRQFDFSVGFNLRQQPRSGEAVSFADMRALADSFDLLRLVIETRKDQICGMQWAIRPRDEKKPEDARCFAIEAALRKPDGEHNWSQWLRALVEDMLVIDAATVYPRRTLGGKPFSLDLMDGATIKRVIDASGRTPAAPEPAYQQVLKGVPAVNYTRDELFYRPRNVRTSRVYGFSPVEQVIMTVNIAIRRQVHQLQYYTEGNIPEALIGVPTSWTTEQIKMFQDYWDSLLEGSTAKRRKAKFVPGDMKYQPTREADLKDQFDDWLARIICYAFSVSPQPFIKEQNRATAEVAQSSADKEGLVPLMQWVKEFLDDVLASYFDSPDLQFTWKVSEKTDPLKAAQAHEIYVRAGVITPDEVRADLGRQPLTDEQKEQIKAAKPQPPAMLAPAGQQAPGKLGQDEQKPGEQGQEPAQAIKVDNHIHLHQADVLVDVGATTIKVGDGPAVEVEREPLLKRGY